jgi:hypothetical protein
MTKKTALKVWISGIGLLGPGLLNWEQGRNILTGTHPYIPRATDLPIPTLLPSAERRRSGAPIKLALAISREAVGASQLAAERLACVFCSSSGDGHNCHAICEALASDDSRISPTRFHNSVNNAAAGYWSIATHSMRASTLLCAYDAGFGAGLLEAAAQAVADGNDVLLTVYDTGYPEPLKTHRPIPDSFGIALVLSATAYANSVASAVIRFSDATPTSLPNSELENLRLHIPAARGLPLLEALASRKPGGVVLDYLDPLRLCIDVSPC